MLSIRRLALLAGLVVMGLVPAGMAQAAAAQPSQQDTQYLQTIHQVNLAEVTGGNAAQQKSSNPQVQELGTRLANDHQQLDQTVQSTASNAGVTLPDAPTADQQAVLDRLQNLSGTEFDTQWVTAELAGHQQAIQATQTEISQGSDPAVTQLAQTALPVLQAHYDALVALAQSLGVPVPGGSATPGTTVTPSPSVSSGSPSPTATTEAPIPGNS